MPRRRTLTLGARTGVLAAAAGVLALPGPAGAASNGARALMPAGPHDVRLLSVGRVVRYDRAQERLSRSALRLRHRVAGARGDELAHRRARRFRVRVADDSPARLRARVHRLRHRLRHARAAAAAAAPTASPALQAIAVCESGGDPTANTGNGFYGKYQFTQATWESVGGSGNPAAASEAEQDRRATILYARAGSSPWLVCGG